MINKNEVIEECLSKLNQFRIKKDAYYSFVLIVEEILKEINKVRSSLEDETEKNRLFHIWGNINHTLNKEVRYIEYEEGRMKKRNAAKIRTVEYFKAVDDACDHIHMDLMTF